MSHLLPLSRFVLLASVSAFVFLAPSFAQAKSPMPAPGVCENGFGTNTVHEERCLRTVADQYMADNTQKYVLYHHHMIMPAPEPRADGRDPRTMPPTMERDRHGW